MTTVIVKTVLSNGAKATIEKTDTFHKLIKYQIKDKTWEINKGWK
jgi:hypothetical protein